MNMIELEKMKSAQIEIMDEVHRICCENKIAYYIIGGTALGALRHGGYIPWDIDIDIAMPREDYERFAEICQKSLSKRYIYRDYRNTKNFTHPHALVCIKNTYLDIKSAKLNPKEENLGIYLDVFPLDKAPEDIELQKKQISKLEFIKELKLLKRAYRYKPDFKNTVIKKIVSAMIFWTDMDKINADFDRECRRYENSDSKLLCSMSSHYRYSKQCMPAEIYGTPQLVKFEDKEYYAPEKLDDYLTRIYGDYMKLPPEDERQANLSFFDEIVFD